VFSRADKGFLISLRKFLAILFFCVYTWKKRQNQGFVCFIKKKNLIILQTFPYLFIIRKISQQKTLSSQMKIWLGF